MADWPVEWSEILVALILVGLVALFPRRRRSDPRMPEEISLRHLSRCWTKENETIHISELAPLWRDERLHEAESADMELRHPRAVAFVEQLGYWSFFRNFAGHDQVCRQIVQLLDREGNCPSVVDVRGDVEAAWDANTYRILARTSLLEHSLNVAEQVVHLLSEQQAWHVIPDTMVAALGHDLGKLDSVRGSLYALGEHPLAAGTALAAIPGFNDLARKEEILRAVRLHHKMPEGLLGKTLKKADQLARQKELEETVLQHTGNREQEIPLSPQTEAGDQRREKTPQVGNDLFTTQSEESAASRHDAPQLMDISRWFDAAGFLEALKPYINRMHGRRFLAFSMADGHVYFQVKVLEEVARKQAERAGCMEIATMGHQDLTMRQVLYSIVHQLRVEHEVIARNLIRENYFGGYFQVTRKFGKDMKGYYTPFHAEAFGSIAEMEQAKPDMLRDILKVSPSLDTGEQN